MNKNIEQVIEIEKQAQAVSQAAMRDAEKLPAQAQEEARSLLEKTRKEAEERPGVYWKTPGMRPKAPASSRKPGSKSSRQKPWLRKTSTRP